ncbi:MAG TPA: DUF4159 domain-containing protein [Verrucomicrobiales bacterium]|nr:DUF4159 domain-containing protein [Verrucomicrobiales bacterium]
MLFRSRSFACTVIILLVTAVVLAAQWRRRWGDNLDLTDPEMRNGVPMWEQDSELPNDVFTFVRLEYNGGGRGRGRGRRGHGGDWATDYPDSDLNFSYRLQQLTSLQVHPTGVHLAITDPRLFDFPFVYMVEPGGLYFTAQEVEILGRYLLNGGFLMVDDFWGDWEWDNFETEIKRVFPGRPIVDLELDHPVFRAVFDLKEKPQVPSIDWAHQGRPYGITYEANKPGAEEVHYRAMFDDAGRMMMIICHNTDLGDGWEREGEDEWYFRVFSEAKAYPMGINILFYALTH